MKSSEIQDLITSNQVKDKILNIIGHHLKEVAYSHNALSEKITFLIEKNRIEDINKLSDHIQLRADLLISIVEKLNHWSRAMRESNSSSIELNLEIKEEIDRYLKTNELNTNALTSKHLQSIAKLMVKK